MSREGSKDEEDMITLNLFLNIALERSAQDQEMGCQSEIGLKEDLLVRLARTL